MGYYNMIYQYGENKFLNKCKQVGVNGLIVVDLPWPENKKFSIKLCISVPRCAASFLILKLSLNPIRSCHALRDAFSDSDFVIFNTDDTLTSI